MKTIQQIPPERIRDFLAKGWLTHDGMWFYNALNTLGIEQANMLNRAAIRSMAPLEMQRTMKILGISREDIVSFEDLTDFLLKALELLMPGSIIEQFRTSIPARNVFRWEWKNGECFAYKGVKLTGCIDRYACGVIYRIDCWLEMLGIEHRIDPPVENCMMHEMGYCRGDIIVNPGNPPR